MAQATAFQLHEAYMEQAWRTMKDSILLKYVQSLPDSRFEGTLASKTPEGLASGKFHVPEGDRSRIKEPKETGSQFLERRNHEEAEKRRQAAAAASTAPPNVDMSTAQTMQPPPVQSPAPAPGANIGGFTGVKDMSVVSSPDKATTPGQLATTPGQVTNTPHPQPAASPAAAPGGIMAPPTSTVGAPTGGEIGPGSGSSNIGPGSVAAPLPTHGPLAPRYPHTPTSPASGQTGVQQPGATNQNQEEPGAGVPEQRTMEQKIRDITATAGKNFTEDMGFGQRVATAGKQAVNNLRGEDGSLQTGLGLRMMPRHRYVVPPKAFPSASPI